MSIKSADQYIRRVNNIPPQAKQILEAIRQLDKQSLKHQISIRAKRQSAIEKIVQYQSNKHIQSKSEIQLIFKDINSIHRRMLRLARKKKKLAQRLYNCIDQPTEELERDLTKILAQKPQTEQKQGKGRRSKKDNGEQYLISEPNYCYCKQPSFGLMVKCQNDACEVQWFHKECIQELKNGIIDKWFCKDCRKNRQKKRNT